MDGQRARGGDGQLGQCLPTFSSPRHVTLIKICITQPPHPAPDEYLKLTFLVKSGLVSTCSRFALAEGMTVQFGALAPPTSGALFVLDESQAWKISLAQVWCLDICLQR